MKGVCRHASNMSMSLDRFLKPQQLPILTAQETDLSPRVVAEANKIVEEVTSLKNESLNHDQLAMHQNTI